MDFLDFSRRTDVLAERLNVTLDEVAQRMGISRASLFAYRKGKSPISEKSIYRLQLAERQAGIPLPAGERKRGLVETHPPQTAAERDAEANAASVEEAENLIAEREQRIEGNNDVASILRANVDLITALEKDNKGLREQIELLRTKLPPVEYPTKRQSQSQGGMNP